MVATMENEAMEKEDGQKDYFEYLQHRSLIGRIYHNQILYPRLCAAFQGKVLDFGCGIGEFLKFRPDTIGVDINTFNVDYCKSLGLKAELLEENGRVPFEKDTFSGIVMDNVIEHIPADDVDAVFDEIARVLEAKGTIVAGVPGTKGYHSDSDHKVFYTEDDLIALFDRHGFEVRKSFHMPLPWHFLEQYLSQYCVYVVFQARQ